MVKHPDIYEFTKTLTLLEEAAEEPCVSPSEEIRVTGDMMEQTFGIEIRNPFIRKQEIIDSLKEHGVRRDIELYIRHYPSDDYLTEETLQLLFEEKDKDGNHFYDKEAMISVALYLLGVKLSRPA